MTTQVRLQLTLHAKQELHIRKNLGEIDPLLDFQSMELFNFILPFKGQFQKIFVMEAMILVAWPIWTTRDDHIFKELG
jgi:hypothetical protein